VATCPPPSAHYYPSVAGFSKSLDEQLKDVLDVVGSALRRVNSSHADRLRATKARERVTERRRLEDAIRLERIRRGIFHDPRLDCVSGNGLMSEVGIGDERLDDDFEARDSWEVETVDHSKSSESEKSESEPPAIDIPGLPIVVLKNYDAKGAVKREAILNVLAIWSAALVENQVRGRSERILRELTGSRLHMSLWQAIIGRA
jgi:hypothetical protein